MPLLKLKVKTRTYSLLQKFSVTHIKKELSLNFLNLKALLLAILVGPCYFIGLNHRHIVLSRL